MVSSLSLAVSYAIASLTPMNQWIGFWLRGSFYTAYQALFVGALLPCGALLAVRYHKRSRSLLAMVLWGAVLGYLAGLFALLLHPLGVCSSNPSLRGEGAAGRCKAAGPKQPEA
jgi:hypothetical protein